MKLHLHIENSPRGSALAHIEDVHLRAAQARYPELAARIEVTIGKNGDILDRALQTADMMISSWPPRDDLRRRAPKLCWIQTTAAGIDHLLPLDWLPADIVLTNNSGPHGVKCEEFCVMALLALATGLPRFVGQQRAHEWTPHFTQPIRGKVCVVIGFGDLGQAAGRACRTLGLKVIAVTRSGQASDLADAAVPDTRIDEVLPGADFVIVTAPLTPRTRDIMSRTRLALLPPGAGLVNVSRARLVDYAALGEMLAAGRLGGAVLDVHDPEPLPPNSPLWDTPNLIVTPHVSSDDPRYADMVLDTWFENFGRHLANRPFKNVVDRERGY